MSDTSPAATRTSAARIQTAFDRTTDFACNPTIGNNPTNKARIAPREAVVASNVAAKRNKLPPRTRIHQRLKKNSAVELYTTTSESVSMEFQFDEDDKPLGERLRNDTFVTPENEAVMKISSELLKKCMDNLCNIEEQVLTLAYGLDGNAPLNYPAIGKQLGYTREGVRVVHNRAISHLRASMGFVA